MGRLSWIMLIDLQHWLVNLRSERRECIECAGVCQAGQVRPIRVHDVDLPGSCQFPMRSVIRIGERNFAAIRTERRGSAATSKSDTCGLHRFNASRFETSERPTNLLRPGADSPRPACSRTRRGRIQPHGRLRTALYQKCPLPTLRRTAASHRTHRITVVPQLMYASWGESHRGTPGRNETCAAIGRTIRTTASPPAHQSVSDVRNRHF